MKYSMENLVDHPYVGQSWVNVICWDLRLPKRLQKKYNSSRKNLRLLYIDRKVMQTKGKGPWSLRKWIGFLKRSPLEEAYFGLGKRRS